MPSRNVWGNKFIAGAEFLWELNLNKKEELLLKKPKKKNIRKEAQDLESTRKEGARGQDLCWGRLLLYADMEANAGLVAGSHNRNELVVIRPENEGVSLSVPTLLSLCLSLSLSVATPREPAGLQLYGFAYGTATVWSARGHRIQSFSETPQSWKKRFGEVGECWKSFMLFLWKGWRRCGQMGFQYRDLPCYGRLGENARFDGWIDWCIVVEETQVWEHPLNGAQNGCGTDMLCVVFCAADGAFGAVAGVVAAAAAKTSESCERPHLPNLWRWCWVNHWRWALCGLQWMCVSSLPPLLWLWAQRWKPVLSSVQNPL